MWTWLSPWFPVPEIFLDLSLGIQEKKKKLSPSALASNSGIHTALCKLHSWEQQPSGFAVIKKMFQEMPAYEVNM